MSSYQFRRHKDIEIAELESKLTSFSEAREDLSITELVMNSNELIYEMHFLLRLHNWPDEFWKSKHLREMISLAERLVSEEQSRRAKAKDPKSIDIRYEIATNLALKYFMWSMAVFLALFAMFYYLQEPETTEQKQRYFRDIQGRCFYYKYGYKFIPGDHICKEAGV